MNLTGKVRAKVLLSCPFRWAATQRCDPDLYPIEKIFHRYAQILRSQATPDIVKLRTKCPPVNMTHRHISLNNNLVIVPPNMI